jgi:uncharacterized protein DUF4395
MKKIFQFGEDVAGYEIKVLNEREIRAAAGIFFLLMFIAVSGVGSGNFVTLKYAVVIFFIDIMIRVFVNPRFAPSLILGRLIVRKQTPEYVGAQQKKFAWIIGVVLASTMMVSFVWLNLHTPITALICFVCLIFLFFETAFGICLGCKVYSLIYRKKAQYCPGEVCEVKDRQDIQKTSLGQWLILVGFVVFIVAIVVLLKEPFSVHPEFLLGMEDPSKANATLAP